MFAETNSVYREKMVHIIFGNNVSPQIDNHGVENNFDLSEHGVDAEGFIEDFNVEFGVDISPIWNRFKTVGDVVCWIESFN